MPATADRSTIAVMITVFDRQQIIRQRTRAAKHLSERDFLFRWTMEQIEDRLDLVNRDFDQALQLGMRGPTLANLKNMVRTDSVPTLSPDIVCEEEFLPFAPKSADLVISALNLHTVNDLPGTLLQINQILKPDGLFLAAMLGGETLYELRTCLQEAEISMTGGLSPRVAPFADKQQMGSLLQRAGFALPVIDSELVTVTYETMFHLMYDLRYMGEGNAIAERMRFFTPRSLFSKAAELYAQKYADPDGRLRATFEIIFLLGWSPHSSQQKPLKPGSAQTRLADYLNTEEIGTGEKPN